MSAVHKPSGLPITIGHVYEDCARAKFPRGSIITIKLENLTVTGSMETRAENPVDDRHIH